MIFLGCSICLANRVSGLVLYYILSHAPILAGVPRSYSCGREFVSRQCQRRCVTDVLSLPARSEKGKAWGFAAGRDV